MPQQPAERTDSQTVKNRLIEIDALKAFAILLILYTHSRSYILDIPVLEWFRLACNYTGLGLFVFLSGYGLQYSFARKKEETFNFFQFLKRRLARVYPLYVLAVIAYYIIFGYFGFYHSGGCWTFSPLVKTFVFHLLSLQVFLYPFTAQICTLWFMGMIIPFYIFFALTVRSKPKRFLITHFGIFSILLVLNLVIGVIDTRVFLYYPTFILGCLCAQQKILPLQDMKALRGWSISTGAITLGLYFLLKSSNPEIFDLPNIDLKNLYHLTSYGLTLIYIVSSIVFSIVLIYQLSGILNRPLIQKGVLQLSNLSYPIYLFHRVVYAIAYGLILDVIELSKKFGTYLFPVVTLLVIVCAYLITYFEAGILKFLSQRVARIES